MLSQLGWISVAHYGCPRFESTASIGATRASVTNRCQPDAVSARLQPRAAITCLAPASIAPVYPTCAPRSIDTLCAKTAWSRADGDPAYPDDRFDGLDGFPFAPHYVDVDSGDGGRLRIHYVDEGPSDGELILCLHGQPTWSYLYRLMIPRLAAAGYRVIAPDLVGFGRSDKPAATDEYTYARHVAWMSDWLRALDLNEITLVCQDWGGLIGLRLVAAFPERFARVVAANTGLPDADGLPPEMGAPMRALYDTVPVVTVQELPERFRAPGTAPGFFYWIRFAAEQPAFRVSELMQVTAIRPLSDAQRDAYDAPFPDDSFMAGARKFPSLVPIFPDDPELPAQRTAWDALRRFDKPFLTAFGDSDPVTAGADARLRREIPGARNQPHTTIRQAGHFLQEDQPEAFADVIIDFVQQNPRR
jgi:haloalkane dehalogenase